MIVAGTGHRPDKVGGYKSEARDRLQHIAATWLADHMLPGDKVITGMALGWDTALALAARELHIPYIAAVPFVGQQKMWPQESKNLFIDLLATADSIKYVCAPGYAPWKMQKRNEWMVDEADVILALWNGSEGGTGNCIQYAQQKEKKIVNLWDEYEKISGVRG
jgi:uncharacterized phage-like protein YoqJ